MGSKSTRVVRQNKSMTATINKLKEVHTELWGLHDSLSWSGNIYLAILMCEYIYKTWTLYLKSKNDFVDIFQVWLLYIKVDSRCFIQLF